MVDERITAIDASIYRVVTKAIIVRDDRILVTLEIPALELYGLPGGGVDHGEEPIESLIRELNEELSLDVNRAQVSSQPVGVRFSVFEVKNFKKYSGMPYLNIYYSVNLRGDQAPKAKEKSFSWFSRQDLRQKNIVNTQTDDIPLFESFMGES